MRENERGERGRGKKEGRVRGRGGEGGGVCTCSRGREGEGEGGGEEKKEYLHVLIRWQNLTCLRPHPPLFHSIFQHSSPLATLSPHLSCPTGYHHSCGCCYRHCCFCWGERVGRWGTRRRKLRRRENRGRSLLK